MRLFFFFLNFLVPGTLKRSFSASGGERQSQIRYGPIELLRIFFRLCRAVFLVATRLPASRSYLGDVVPEAFGAHPPRADYTLPRSILGRGLRWAWELVWLCDPQPCDGFSELKGVPGRWGLMRSSGALVPYIFFCMCLFLGLHLCI